MTVANLTISVDLLLDVLCLPRNTEILDAYTEGDYSGVYTIVLRVSHPDIPDGAMDITAQMRRQDPVVFEGWHVLTSAPKLD